MRILDRIESWLRTKQGHRFMAGVVVVGICLGVPQCALRYELAKHVDAEIAVQAAATAGASR